MKQAHGRHCLNLLHPLALATWGYHSVLLLTTNSFVLQQSYYANTRRSIRSATISFPSTATASTSPSTRITMTRQDAAADTSAANKESVSLSLSHDLGLPSPLILGSASYTRQLILRELLGQHGIATLVRPIDEKGIGCRQTDPPVDLVLKLGQAKMDHLVQEIRAGRCQDDLPTKTTACNDNDLNKSDEWVILTGDQVVTCNGQILEKPESIHEAKEFCSRYATFPPSTVGSCILTHLPSGIQVSGVDTATIHFRNNTPGDALVDRLLQDEAPILSCAGGLMVEHAFVKEYILRIDGTEDSAMGLSKDLVARLLRELAAKVKEHKDKAK
jgi:septum formation protein